MFMVTARLSFPYEKVHILMFSYFVPRFDCQLANDGAELNSNDVIATVTIFPVNFEVLRGKLLCSPKKSLYPVDGAARSR